MKTITLFLGFIISLSTMAQTNFVTKGDFESGTSSGWISKAWNGSINVQIDGDNPISGAKTLLVNIISRVNLNYGSRNIRYQIPIIKGAQYKISFKAKASAPGTIRGSFDKYFGSYPQVDEKIFDITTTTQTYEYTTNAFPEVVGVGCFSFLLGTLEAGTKLWLDDISITEVTFPMTDGNICNGNFESDVANEPYFTDPQIYGWSKHIDGVTATYEIDQANPISGSKSMKITGGVGTPAIDGWRAQLIWPYSPILGQQWMCEFKARSTADFTMTVESFDSYVDARTNWLFKDDFNITSETQVFKCNLDIPSSVQVLHETYYLSFWVAKLPIGESVTIDDVKFYQYVDDEITNAHVIKGNNNNVYIKCIHGQIFIDTRHKGVAKVYSVTGQLMKNFSIDSGSNHFFMDKGIYIVQVIQDQNIVESLKVLVE